MPDTPVSTLLNRIKEAEDAYAEPGEPAPSTFEVLQAADELLDLYRSLTDMLKVRAFAPAPGTDDRTEQVVVTVYDVDLHIRGRTDGEGGGDLFVRGDPDGRDRLDRARHPLTVEVGHAGEHTYGSGAGVWTCVCGHEVPGGADNDDEINDHVRQCDDVARRAAAALSGPRLTTNPTPLP